MVSRETEKLCLTSENKIAIHSLQWQARALSAIISVKAKGRAD